MSPHAVHEADCLRDCTEAQQEAIRHVEGPLLILAGAGSGKTRVVTRRLAYLVAKGVDPSSILAITFTNKAANEMRERVASMGVPAGAWVSTFHSTCARLLRIYGERLGFQPNFVIYDAGDAQTVVKQAIEELKLDLKEFKPAKAAAAISLAKNQMKTPEDIMFEGYEGQNIGRIYERYAALLKQRNAMDFDDLLICVVDLLTHHEDVRERLQSRFRFVMVDEYQDTNRPQYLMAKLLCDKHRNLSATGDPDQSIYAWRGADVRNILDFERDYPDAHVVRLEQNYRSTKAILRAASSLIRQNVARKDKELWTENPEGAPVLVIECDDEVDEGNQVASAVREIADAGRGTYGDCAVFYRTNAQSRSIETALASAGIPYVVVQGVAFYQRKEIKDLLSLLRLLANPRDLVALERVATFASKGLGATSLARFRRHAEQNGLTAVESLEQAEVAGVKGAAARSAAGLALVLRELRTKLELGPKAALEAAILRTRYLDEVRAQENAKEREENVQELINSAARFEVEAPDGGVAGFLEQAALVSDADGLVDASGQVKLMTFHCAKGLEFDYVCMVGMEEGLAPMLRSDGEDNLEEERRLCFVGMTRARKELRIYYAAQRTRYGKTEYSEPSRFLEELSEEGVERSRGEAAFRKASVRPPMARDAGLRPRLFQRPAPLPFAPRPKRRESAAPSDPFSAGDWVLHAKFGRGRVASLSGYGAERRALVVFTSGESKTLVLKFANLTKIE